MFERLKRVIRSRVNGIFDTTPTPSYEPMAWNESSPESVRRRPIPNSSEEAIIEDLQTSTTLERRLADELYNVMTMDEAIPWLMNLSRLLEKKSEGWVGRLDNAQVHKLISGIDEYVSKFFLTEKCEQVNAELEIDVTFDSVSLSASGRVFNKCELTDCVEVRGGVSRSVASWWVEMVLLLLPLHKNILPQVSVTTENGKYILRRK